MSRLDKLIKELCPDGVEYKKISEKLTILRGKRLTKDMLSDEGEFPVYHGGLEPLGYYFEENRDANTVMIINVGASAGTVGFAKERFWSSDGCFCLSKSNEIIPKFLFYVLSCKEHFLMSKVRKAGIPTLDAKVIGDIKIPVPPLEIQEEIVKTLDKFTSYVTELQAELQARRQQYVYYRNKLIYDCKAEKGKLIDLLIQPITDGPHTTPVLVEEGIPFISATAVYDGRVHLEDAQGFITKEFDLECSKKYKPKRNDIYMVKSGSTTGKVAFVDIDEDFNIWSPLAAMRASNETTARFIYHLLQTSKIQAQVNSKKSKGSQPNLSMRVLEQFEVPIPSLEEQMRIVAILNNLDDMCNDIFKGIPAEIEAHQKQYEYYRNKLLTFKELS